MADGINWGVNTPNYGGFAPQPINWGALEKPQPQQPGQPLNISAAANQPTWFDRLRSFFSGNVEGMSPQPTQTPNTIPPSGTADVGVGPGTAAPQLDRNSMDAYLLDKYGTVGSNYWAPGPQQQWEQRQEGGPVYPGYANRMMLAGDVVPMPSRTHVRPALIGVVPGVGNNMMSPMGTMYHRMGDPGAYPNLRYMPNIMQYYERMSPQGSNVPPGYTAGAQIG
jgi:hypothetical protein